MDISGGEFSVLGPTVKNTYSIEQPSTRV